MEKKNISVLVYHCLINVFFDETNPSLTRDYCNSKWQQSSEPMILIKSPYSAFFHPRSHFTWKYSTSQQGINLPSCTVRKYKGFLIGNLVFLFSHLNFTNLSFEFSQQFHRRNIFGSPKKLSLNSSLMRNVLCVCIISSTNGKSSGSTEDSKEPLFSRASHIYIYIQYTHQPL